MISPMTPSGTKVVCIRTPNSAVGCFSGQPLKANFPLEVGGVYEVVSIVPQKYSSTGFAAKIAGHNQFFFSLHLLRRLDLPESLTSLLNVKPVDAPQRETAQ